MSASKLRKLLIKVFTERFLKVF